MPWTVGLADSLRVGGEIAIKRQLGSGTERGNAAAKRDGQARQEQVSMCRRVAGQGVRPILARIVVTGAYSQALGTAQSDVWCGSDVNPRGGAVCWSRRKGCAWHVKALLDAGVLSRSVAGAIEFPFESVKVEFMLIAA